jgi:hypothetical protein
MSTAHVVTRKRRASAVTMLVLGGGFAVASLIGNHGNPVAIVPLAVVVAALTLVFSLAHRSQTDLGAITGDVPDERQRTISLRAASVAGSIVAMALIIATMVSMAQGHFGEPWIWFCALGGVSYLVAILVFRDK